MLWWTNKRRVRTLSNAALCVLLLSFLPLAAEALPLIDDRGAAIERKRPAARIVSLAPFITELIYAVGAGGKLIAVSAYSDYPPAARALPRVGDAATFDVEKLLALRPDLVIAWKSGNSLSEIERLERLHIPVLVVEAQKLDDIPRVMRLIGSAAGAADGETAARNFTDRLTALRLRHRDKRLVSVFLEIWHSPLMTVSGRHFASDALTVCRGANVFADAAGLTVHVNVESVLAADPEAIVGGASNEDRGALARNWQRFPYLKAVRNGHIFYLHPDLIQRQTPRILDGVEQLCAALESTRKPAGSPK
ncbi:MAG: cobalamin-binding protein [Burkholderiales bacterium]|nr:cobalamin-binding protein [Burkholderiales bacterium]